MKTIYVFGGGRVSAALLPLLRQLEFHTVLYEREDCGLAEDETVIAPYGEALIRVAPAPGDGVVILTRGHEADVPVLEQMLKTPVTYIGLKSHLSRAEEILDALRQSGEPEASVARVRTPVGAGVPGKTPMEIAVAIAAELIVWRAGETKSKAKPPA